MPSIEGWKKEGEETKLAGKPGISIITQNFTNPETDKSEEYAFCRKAPGVTVMPILSNGNIIITRTFKHGLNRVVWEFPAGRKPKNVSVANQASAELSEESGLITGRMVYLGCACVAPRKFDTYEDLFVALDCKLGKPHPEPGEILEVYEITPEELWEIIRKYDGSLSGFSEIAAMRATEADLIRRS